MNKLQNLRARAAQLVAGAGALALTGAAMAQGDPFADAVTAATTKITTYGGLLVGVAAVGVGFMIAIKFLKKVPKAA